MIGISLCCLLVLILRTKLFIDKISSSSQHMLVAVIVADQLCSTSVFLLEVLVKKNLKN